MRKTIITAVVVLGFSGGVYAESAIKQLETMSGLKTVAVPAGVSRSAAKD